MATPPLNLSGMDRLSGQTASQPKVSDAVRRLFRESQRVTQMNDLLVSELASGVLPAGAAQQVGRQIQKNQSIARFNSSMARAKFAEEQATEGRSAKFAMAAIPALGTLAAQYIGSSPGEAGDAATGGMEQAWQETVSPGDLTVPGGAAAQLQAQATKQAQQSQLGVPALQVDPSVLAAQGRVGSVQAIDPMAPAGATSPSLTGEYYVSPQALEDARMRQSLVAQEGLTEPRSLYPMYRQNLLERLPAYTAPRAIPAREGVPAGAMMDSDLRDETLAIRPRPAESGFGAAGVAKAEPREKPDTAQLISAAMDIEDDEKKKEELRKIIEQYGLAMGGE
tara:strand:+ start:27216 stop:28226 length:1011 start_codon:yes stop_codon:yes gene_type:complete